MRLKDYLLDRKESDEDFAARAGVSRATVKRIHATGEARSASTIQKIVAATGGDVGLDDLVAPLPARQRRLVRKAAL
jgi:transcriptional regulator with XRE-family HTH domain